MHFFNFKVKNKTGKEIFVVVLNYVNEETFLGFAGIEPYFESENDEETCELTNLYFPEGAVDELPIELADIFVSINDQEEEYEEDNEDEELYYEEVVDRLSDLIL